MNNLDLINSIFFPRPSNIPKDDNDHLIDVGNNINVGVRFFLYNKSYPSILFFHGNGEIARDYDEIAEYYNRLGINLIVADYQGYGLSNGKPTKNNLHNDANIIFKYVNDYLFNNKYIGKRFIMGRSLGSASAFEIATKFYDLIDGCIIESGFATEYPLLQLMQIDPKSIGFKLEDGFMNLSKIMAYKGPLLIIHADMDDIIPFSQADLIYIKSTSTEKDMYKVTGANHNNILSIAREEYFKRIKKFISN